MTERQRRQEILALIPARGGSRRVKNKNLRLLGGKPLIAHTIAAARQSRYITRIVVSTDRPAIAAIARESGAEVPFLRPCALATADSTEFEFHEHALRELRAADGYTPDLIVNLYPTTPFRTAASIDRAIRLMLGAPRAHSLRSVRRCHEHPYKMWVFRRSRYLRPFVAGTPAGSQTLSYHLLPTVHIQNASIYIVRPRTLATFGNTVGMRVLGFEMSEFESIDINTEQDFALADAMIAGGQRGKGL